MELLEKIKLAILQVMQNKNLLNDFRINRYQVYAFTNENIAGCFNNLDINSKDKVLSICSSGDHMLNLAMNGVRDIDLIDVNPMTEFFAIGIRIPLILNYSYQEYQKVIEFLFKSRIYDLELENKILYGLLPFMGLKYRTFFEEIFDYYFELQKNYHIPIKLMQILTTDYYFNMDEITFYNLYMQSEENYQKLKNEIGNINLFFILGSIFDIKSQNKYGLVLCSNALEQTYIPECDILKLKEKFKNLKSSITKDGIILASYIYEFYNRILETYDNYPIKGTDITFRELLKEELIIFDSYKKHKDAVLVLRK